LIFIFLISFLLEVISTVLYRYFEDLYNDKTNLIFSLKELYLLRDSYKEVEREGEGGESFHFFEE